MASCRAATLAYPRAAAAFAIPPYFLAKAETTCPLQFACPGVPTPTKGLTSEMSSRVFGLVEMYPAKAPKRSVLVMLLKLVTKYRWVPSVSTPVQELGAPGTIIVVPGINAPVTGLYWLYVHASGRNSSPLLMRKLPFGRTVKASDRN